jgi:hypothetical protein
LLKVTASEVALISSPSVKWTLTRMEARRV